ncbi:hypothetical protein Taro_007852 [Colocasia esculenta]|uniref:Uncharacterized protein n=1 Tax=Colocasia esculenta TaxID=4460 RepID=A0A843U1H2_COLES|nr:hypothetical protein [Colocasia esculenta]
MACDDAVNLCERPAPCRLVLKDRITMTGCGKRSAQSRRYEQNRKLKNFVKGLKPSVRAMLLELDSHTLEGILGVATKQGSRAGPI